MEGGTRGREGGRADKAGTSQRWTHEYQHIKAQAHEAKGMTMMMMELMVVPLARRRGPWPLPWPSLPSPVPPWWGKQTSGLCQAFPTLSTCDYVVNCSLTSSGCIYHSQVWCILCNLQGNQLTVLFRDAACFSRQSNDVGSSITGGNTKQVSHLFFFLAELLQIDGTLSPLGPQYFPFEPS
jgi:hypothetical protein